MKIISILKKTTLVEQEITLDFYNILEKHIIDTSIGYVIRPFEMQEVADMLQIEPSVLYKAVKHTTGQTPADIYKEKIMLIACSMLIETSLSIATIANILAFSSPTFITFFKENEGIHPKLYREYSKLSSSYVKNGTLIQNIW